VARSWTTRSGSGTAPAAAAAARPEGRAQSRCRRRILFDGERGSRSTDRDPRFSLREREGAVDSQTIRERFIKFFEAKGHVRLPSAPLVLKDDPSVLFTSAGMQPLVPYFNGVKQPPAKRLVTIQKVFRATDIEEVGKDGYHQTFFEMLGNFGIGDYWKKDAVAWGWQLLTEQFGFDASKLVATIYFDDDEAFDVWTKELKLLPPEKVFRLGNL